MYAYICTCVSSNSLIKVSMTVCIIVRFVSACFMLATPNKMVDTKLYTQYYIMYIYMYVADLFSLQLFSDQLRTSTEYTSYSKDVFPSGAHVMLIVDMFWRPLEPVVQNPNIEFCVTVWPNLL